MPVAMLAKIYNAISQSINNYDRGVDYYGSPVHEVFGIETGKEPQTSWPFIRKEFLLDGRNRLTPFPHNYTLDDAEERDLPAVFFYEMITSLEKGEVNENLRRQCGEYFCNGREPPSASRLAKILFFESYAYMLSILLLKNQVSLEELLAGFQDFLSNCNDQYKDVTELDRYNFYIRKAYEHYKIVSRKPFNFNDKFILRFQDRNRNYPPKLRLYGPAFMMRAVSMSFNTCSLLLTFGNTSGERILIDDFTSSVMFDLAEDGCKPLVVACLYCMAAEWFLSNHRKEGSSMPTIPKNDQWVLEQLHRDPILRSKVERLIEESLNQKSNYRFMASPTVESPDLSTTTKLPQTEEDLDAYIITTPTQSPVEEYRSLHVLVPNDSTILEGIIQIRFHFFDRAYRELPFTCIGAYDQDNELDQPCDAYYFLPDPRARLPERYPFCRVIARAYPADETTADVVVLVD